MAGVKEKSYIKCGNSAEIDYSASIVRSQLDLRSLSSNMPIPTPFKRAEILEQEKKAQYKYPPSIDRLLVSNRSSPESGVSFLQDGIENTISELNSNLVAISNHPVSSQSTYNNTAEWLGISDEAIPLNQSLSTSEASSGVFSSTFSSLVGMFPFNFKSSVSRSCPPPDDSVVRVTHSFSLEGGELDTGTGVRLHAQRQPHRVFGLISAGNKRDVEVEVDGRAEESYGGVQVSPEVALRFKNPKENDPYILELPKAATINNPQQAKLHVLRKEGRGKFEKVDDKKCLIEEKSNSIFVKFTSLKKYVKFVVIVKTLIENTAKAIGNSLPNFRPPVTYKVDFAIYGPIKIERAISSQIYFSRKAFIPENIPSKPDLIKWDQNSIPLGFYQDLKVSASVQEEGKWMVECNSPIVYKDDLHINDLTHRGIQIKYLKNPSKMKKFNLSVKVAAQQEDKSVSCEITSPPPSINNNDMSRLSGFSTFQDRCTKKHNLRKKNSPTESVMAIQDYSTPRMYLLQFTKGDCISVLGNETISAVKDGCVREWKLGLVNKTDNNEQQIGFFNTNHVQNACSRSFSTVSVDDVMSHILTFCDNIVVYDLRKIQCLLERQLGWCWKCFEDFSEADIQGVITANPRNLPDQVSEAISVLNQKKGSTSFVRSLIYNLLRLKKKELAIDIIIDCIFMTLAMKLKGSWCNVAFKLRLNSKKQESFRNKAHAERILGCEGMETNMIEGLTMFREWSATTNSKKECLEMLQKSLSECKKDRLLPYVEGAFLLILAKGIF